MVLQPVKPGHVGGGKNKCVRFTLVAAPRVKNVTYIKARLRQLFQFLLVRRA